MAKIKSERPAVGVIRWDYLNGGDKDTNCELKSLSPKEFHNKVPFFLTIEDDITVSGNENRQDVIDEQIRYAQNAGIDYWAFISGTETDPDAPERYALEKYISSTVRSKIKFCLILHKYDKSSWEERVNRIVKYMKDPGYVTVLHNRPVVYIFSVSDIEAEFGTGDCTKQALELIRLKAAQAGLPDPYIVAMCSCVRIQAESEYVDNYKIDAISAYSFVGKRENMDANLPFEDLAKQNRESWSTYLATNKKLIPLISFGRNEKPRLVNPPPWGGGHGPYWDNPSPDEVSMQLKAGIDLVNNHKESCEANTVLCYAWNEYNEGGWICPTHFEGTTKLDAISELLNKIE